MLKDALRKIVQALDKHQIPYALIGALAVAAHGYVRATKDVDLLIDWPLPRAKELVGLLEADKVVAEFRKGHFEDPVAGVIRATVADADGPISIDLLFPSRAWQRPIVSDAEIVDQEGIPVRVARAKDVFLLKLYAGGPQDLLDAAQLYETKDADTKADWKEGATSIGESDAFKRCLLFLA